ncbi:MAG: TetR/AcrR family transcriptional regulator [Bacteroidetes bacterium]|nr:TetR/AcrR family transcriptional regulator [Bacteroidota bacterium]
MVLTEKHTQILEKAELLFAEKGFDGTSVRDIADYAGVNLAMINYYFGSKEKLLEAMFHYRMAATRERLEDIIANKTLSFFQKVEILIDEHINKVLNKQCFFRILFQAQVINKNKQILKIIREYKLGYTKLISSLIEEGQKAKLIRKEIDVVLLLTTMTGTVTQVVINKDFYREFNNHKKMPDQALNELLKNKLSTHIKQVFKSIMGYEE